MHRMEIALALDREGKGRGDTHGHLSTVVRRFQARILKTQYLARDDAPSRLPPQARTALLAAYYVLDEGGQVGLSRDQLIGVLTTEAGVGIDREHVSRAGRHSPKRPFGLIDRGRVWGESLKRENMSFSIGRCPLNELRGAAICARATRMLRTTSSSLSFIPACGRHRKLLSLPYPRPPLLKRYGTGGAAVAYSSPGRQRKTS